MALHGFLRRPSGCRPGLWCPMCSTWSSPRFLLPSWRSPRRSACTRCWKASTAWTGCTLAVFARGARAFGTVFWRVGDQALIDGAVAKENLQSMMKMTKISDSQQLYLQEIQHELEREIERVKAEEKLADSYKRYRRNQFYLRLPGPLTVKVRGTRRGNLSYIYRCFLFALTKLAGIPFQSSNCGCSRSTSNYRYTSGQTPTPHAATDRRD